MGRGIGEPPCSLEEPAWVELPNFPILTSRIERLRCAARADPQAGRAPHRGRLRVARVDRGGLRTGARGAADGEGRLHAGGLSGERRRGSAGRGVCDASLVATPATASPFQMEFSPTANEQKQHELRIFCNPLRGISIVETHREHIS